MKGSNPQQDHARQMYGRIQARLRRYDESLGFEKAFMCKKDLRAIWSNLKDVRRLFTPNRFDDATLGRIRNEFRIAISTFVMIDLEHHLEEYIEHFLSAGDTLVDDKMPFSKERLAFMDVRLADSFIEKQFIFLPLYIDNHRNAKEILQRSIQYRLPFIDEPRSVASGSYGKISSVKVAKRYLRNTDENTSNDQDELVAFKTFENRTDFYKEVGTLNFLRESLRGHEHITIHIAALIHGNTFYIFLPYAEHGSLEVFLCEGIDSSNGTDASFPRYDFKSKFPKVTPSALFQQISALADALSFLHEIELPGSATGWCAHNDFRPDNILMFPKAGMPVGKWTISDFGISSHHENYYSIRNIVENTDSKLAEENLTGAYRAPEAHPDSKQKYSGKRSDVWSMVCLICEVLTFSLGGSKLLKDFRSKRLGIENHDDWFFEKLDHWQGEFRVKPSVLNWLDYLDTTYYSAGSWVKECTNIIRKDLKIEPLDRRKAKEVRAELFRVQVQVGGYIGTRSVNMSSMPVNPSLSTQPLESRTSRPTSTESSNLRSTVSSSLSLLPKVGLQESSSGQSQNLVSLSLPRGWRTHWQDWDLSPNGSHAVYLSKPASSKSSMVILDLTSRKTQEIDLPQRVQWSKIRIAYPYIGIHDLGSKRRKQLRLYSIHEGKIGQDLPTEVKSRVAAIHPSSIGIYALQTSNSIILHDFDLKEPDRELFVPREYTIFTAAFNSSATALFVWASTGSRDDLLYVWNVQPFPKAQRARYEIPTDHIRNPLRSLYPCAGQPHCAIRSKGGSLFFATSESDSLRPCTDFSTEPVASVATDSSLIYVGRDGKVREQRFPTGEDDSAEEAAEEIGRFNKVPAGSVKLAVGTRIQESSMVLLICNKEGKLELLSKPIQV